MDAKADAVLTFDPASRTFIFSQDSDLSLSGSKYKIYQVQVIGEAGNIRTVKGINSFSLTLKNPCIDPAYVTIEKAELLNYAYNLFMYDPIVRF